MYKAEECPPVVLYVNMYEAEESRTIDFERRHVRGRCTQSSSDLRSKIMRSAWLTTTALNTWQFQFQFQFQLKMAS